MLAAIQFSIYLPVYLKMQRLKYLHKTILLPVVLYKHKTWSLTAGGKEED
jgi:hypothetical protein